MNVEEYQEIWDKLQNGDEKLWKDIIEKIRNDIDSMETSELIDLLKTRSLPTMDGTKDFRIELCWPIF
ncbi:MAG: hypothetical protein LLF83_08660 [Methanobacterium sp.]|nr:hypothetical protein [Methanobacterium sp.]